MAELKQNTVSLAALIKERLSLNGVNIAHSDNMYDELLTDDLMAATVQETAKNINNHNGTYACAVGLAFGEFSVEQLAQDKTIDKITGSTKVGHTTVTSTVSRKGVDTIPPKKEGGEVTRVDVYGKQTLKVETKSEELSRVKSHVKGLGRKMLADLG